MALQPNTMKITTIELPMTPGQASLIGNTSRNICICGVPACGGHANTASTQDSVLFRRGPAETGLSITQLREANNVMAEAAGMRALQHPFLDIGNVMRQKTSLALKAQGVPASTVDKLLNLMANDNCKTSNLCEQSVRLAEDAAADHLPPGTIGPLPGARLPFIIAAPVAALPQLDTSEAAHLPPPGMMPIPPDIVPLPPGIMPMPPGMQPTSFIMMEPTRLHRPKFSLFNLFRKNA